MVYISIITGIVIFTYLLRQLIKWKPIIPSLLNRQELFIYGHRGVPSLIPENTISSFQKAFELNVDGIELDIQITKDRELVVHHDPHLEQLTGKQMLISDLKYDEISKIDARGENFTYLDFQSIPLLEDILKILPKDMVVNVEIKSQQLCSEGMEKHVVDLILKFDLLERAIVSSFNPLCLRKMKKLNSQITTAQLWDEEEEFSSPYWIYISRPDLFHGNIDQFTERKVNHLRELGLKVYAYTVNTSTQLEKVKCLKLDGIFTDDPTICNKKY